MSTVIDKNIVQMSLDPRDLKKGIDTSLHSIAMLKASMNFGQAVKDFGDLNSAANKIDFTMLGRGIESVSSRLNAMGIVAATVINNITTSIINSAKDLFYNAMIAPITQGLAEYETQMGAIQTILANTSAHGTTLDDVSGALEELNAYADKTIYNFTQMTDSIGKFTTAGVDLPTSVSAIKGIANAAALSGSNAQQASTAMYQLSQAISSGVVRLQDWISVENAGMGGEIFKNSLIETARVHGVAIDDILEAEGGFRSSLQTGWLSSEIMLETLSKFTGDLTAEQLVAMGYTEDQIAAIIKMGQTANDAATKIKTFSQLKDTIAEALQSGWSQSWAIIFGDFEEAKEMFGGIGDALGVLVGDSADARNNMLIFWKALGGRDTLIETFHSALNSVIHIVTIFKEAVSDIFPPVTSMTLYKITVGLKNLVDMLKMGGKSSERFKSIIRGLASILDIFRLLIVAVAKPIIDLIRSLSPAADGFFDMAAGAGDWLFALRNTIKETDFFGGVVGKLIERIKPILGVLMDLKDRFLSLEIIQDLIDYLNCIEGSDVAKVIEGLKKVLQGLITIVAAVAIGVRNLCRWFFELEIVQKALSYLVEKFTYANFKKFLQFVVALVPKIRDAFDRFKITISDVSKSLSTLKDSFMDSALLKKTIELLKSFDGSSIAAFIPELKENFTWVQLVFSKLKDGFSWLSNVTKEISPELSEMARSVEKAIIDIMDTIIDAKGNLDFTALLGAINTGLFAGLLLTIRKVFKGDWLSEIFNKLLGSESSIGSSAIAAFESFGSVMTSWQNNLKADTLLKIAGAIGILALALIGLTFVDSNKLLDSAVAIGVVTGEMIATGAILSKMNTADLIKATTAIIGLSVGLLIMSIAVMRFSSLDSDELTRGLVGIGIAIGELVLAVLGLSIGTGTKDIIKSTVAILMMGVSLIVLSKAVKVFGSIDYETMENGLMRIGIVLAGFVAYTKLMSGAQVIESVVALLLMSGSLLLLSKGLSSLGSISWDTLLRGLVALAGSLTILAVAVKVMSGSLSGAAAIIIVSGAVLILAGAMTILGNLSWEQILLSLGALAGAFVVFGLAGLVLAPIVPALLGLGIAIALIGVGSLALGAGLLLAATGLAALAASSAAIAGAIVVVGGAIISVLPALGEAIALALVTFVTTIANKGPELLAAGKTLILTLVQAIVETTPAIVQGLFDLIAALLKMLLEQAPAFLQQGYDLLLEFLKGIADNVEEVVETALLIVTEFIDGLTEGIPDLVESAFNFIEAFVTALTSAIGTHTPTIVSSILGMGVALVEGFAQAIWDNIQLAIDAVLALGGSVLDAIKALFGIASPSKVMYGVAENNTAGFINGTEAGIPAIVKSFVKMAKKAQNGMNRVLDSIRDSIDDDLIVAPVIRPVLDMGNVNAGLYGLNRSWSGARIAADISTTRSFGNPSEDNKNSIEESEEGRIQYIQNNYSPKALSTLEIYRQTKMQVSKIGKTGRSV